MTPGTTLYRDASWTIAVYNILPSEIIVVFGKRNSQRKLLDQCASWDPVHRLWLQGRWRPVGRVPDGVLREVERKLREVVP